MKWFKNDSPLHTSIKKAYTFKWLTIKNGFIFNINLKYNDFMEFSLSPRGKDKGYENLL